MTLRKTEGGGAGERLPAVWEQRAAAASPPFSTIAVNTRRWRRRRACRCLLRVGDASCPRRPGIRGSETPRRRRPSAVALPPVVCSARPLLCQHLLRHRHRVVSDWAVRCRKLCRHLAPLLLLLLLLLAPPPLLLLFLLHFFRNSACQLGMIQVGVTTRANPSTLTCLRLCIHL